MKDNGIEVDKPNPEPNPNLNPVEEPNVTTSPNPNPDPDRPDPMLVEESNVGENPNGDDMAAGEEEDENSQLPDDEVEPEEDVEPESEPEPEPVPVKRKRGRPPKSQSAKVVSAKKKKVEAKKKDEEDVCFICFDGGNLVVCHRRECPKVYHPVCVNRDDNFFQTTGSWNCGWHICSICEKAAHYMCYTCTYSLCKVCIKEAGFVCIRGNKGFCETCYRSVLLIESNGDANQAKVESNLDDESSFEYLFKYYWFDVKAKLSLTLKELNNAKIPSKGAGASAKIPSKGAGASAGNEELSDESYNANEDHGGSSDSSSEHHGGCTLKKKRSGRPRTNAAVAAAGEEVDNGRTLVPEGTEWASKELVEFVGHMKGGDKSAVTQFDVQSLLLQYIKQNNLRDPRRKSQIICDTRLEILFGKARVAHFEMLKLLESHFHIKESTQVIADVNQREHLDPDFGPRDAEGHNDASTKLSNDKRRKYQKKGGEREPQTNLDDYAAVDVHNINLIYMRRNFMEDLLEDVNNFNEKVVGSFVRIRISATGQKYRLVQILGTSKAAKEYKTGRKTTDFTLEVLNLDKKEVITIDSVSNQEFTEEECKRLRQSIKCGLISRLTVGGIQEKTRALQAVRVNDWLESEKLRLCHLRDRASETGRRKELRECVEKLQLLSTTEERRRILNEVPEIHADPNMDPDYESAEEGDTDEKNQDNFNRAGDFSSLKKGRDGISPRGGIASSNRAGVRRSSNSGWEFIKNARPGEPAKLEAISGWGDKINEQSWTQADTWETATNQSAGLETETMTSFSPSDTSSETEKLWYYKDPSESIQGPFNMIQLRKWSPHFPKDMKIWRGASEDPEDSILLTDALNGKFEGPTDTTKGDEWSFPSPTPEQPSQRGSPGTSSGKDEPSRSWGVWQNSSMDAARPAQGEWGTALQGNTNMGMKSLAQGSANVAWGSPGQENPNPNPNTGWGIPPNPNPNPDPNPNAGWGTALQVKSDPNAGWGKALQVKSDPNAGWGTALQVKSDPNAGWGTALQVKSDPNAGWGTTLQVKSDPNAGWGTPLKSDPNAGWGTPSWGQDRDGWGTKQNHPEDRYREGRHDHGNSRSGGGDPHYDSRNERWRNQRDDRMNRDNNNNNGRGGRGGQGGPTGICKFHEGGYCRKGAACKYLHL